MTGARELSSAAGVIQAAIVAGQRFPMDLASALDAAGLLMRPETAADVEQSVRERVAADLVLWADRMEAALPAFADVRRDAYYVRRSARVAVSGLHLYTSVRPESEHAFLSEVERLRARIAELECAAGAVAEQHHQIFDPPEPPLGCFMTGDICALADAPVVDVTPAAAVGGAPC